MRKHPSWPSTAACLCLLAAAAGVSAQPKASDLKARYESDLKLCAEEPSSNARLQCRRDAKAEYDKALAAAKAAGAAAAPKPGASAAAPACTECGKVSAITEQEREGEASALGTIAGGAAGAVLGRQIGGGFGRDLATVAGAVGGAYAGREIEKKARARKVWVVTVQYNDGRTAQFDFEQEPDFKVGDAVKNSGASIVKN